MQAELRSIKTKYTWPAFLRYLPDVCQPRLTGMHYAIIIFQVDVGC